MRRATLRVPWHTRCVVALMRLAPPLIAAVALACAVASVPAIARAADKDVPSKNARALALDALKREMAETMIAIVAEAAAKSAQPQESAWTKEEPPGVHRMWRPTIHDAAATTRPPDDAPKGFVGAPVMMFRTIANGDGGLDLDSFDHGRGRLSHVLVARALPKVADPAHLAPEAIQRIVRARYGTFKLCYASALKRRPDLEGRLVVKFVIDPSGAVSSAADGGSDLPDSDVVACVVRNFANLTFPPTTDEVITVVYPLTFSPY